MRLFLFLLFLPALAIAENKVEPYRVLSVVTADWNGDGRKDRALLVGNPEAATASLYIYLGTREGFDAVEFIPAFVWSGSMWGQQPGLTVSESGSLLVHSLNIGMGRNRWEQTLTIAYRDARFVVAGFTFQYHDSLDPEDHGFCDLNLLTGRGVVALSGEAEQEIDGIAFGGYVSDWHMDSFPGECM